MKLRYIMAAAALLLLSSGFTLAYMKDSAYAENTFSFVGEKGLDAVLSEPSWKPEAAVQILPGAVLAKDPCVTNTSEADLDELVALRMEFIYSESCPDTAKRGEILSEQDMEALTDVVWIDYNADTDGDWIRFDGEDRKDPVQNFYYASVLERNLPEQGDTTVPLFTCLTMDAGCGNDRFRRLQEMNGFEIRISGIVLQHMEGEQHFGLDSAEAAYRAGLFENKK